MEAELARLRVTTSDQTLASVIDSRRRTISTRLLRADPGHGVALQEMATAAYYDLDWRLNRVRVRGGWPRRDGGGLDRAVWRARDRALQWADRALAVDSGAWWPHEVRARVHALLREYGSLDEAAETARQSHPDSARTHLWAGLAAHRLDRPAEAEAAFGVALGLLSPGERAVYHDPRGLLSAAEERAWEADSAEFAAVYWSRRDPRRLTAVSERWLEHVARLTYADLVYHDLYRRQPGRATVRGETHVRYGLPAVERWVLAPKRGLFHTWVYDGFVLVFDDLGAWGDLVHADELVAREAARRVGSRYELTPPGGRFEVPTMVSRFREPDGSTSLVVAVGVPVRPDVEAGRPISLRAGAFVLDGLGDVVARGAGSLEGRANALRETSRGRLWNAGRGVARHEAGRTVRVEVEQTGAAIFGSYDVPLTPPLPRGGLVLSDLLLGSAAEEAGRCDEAGPLVCRGDVAFRPVALAEYAVGDPIYVYWEAYGLGLDGGRHRYELTSALVPERRGGVVGRLLERRRAGVSVGFEGTGVADTVGDYVVLDASDQAPGAYRLTLTVRDLLSGLEASASRRVVLRR